MLSARTIFQEIFDHDEAFRLFCSIAAAGEAQGGWENGRIAALVPASQRDLAPKIARHGADEDKHGRIFNGLLRKRGLEPVPVPPDTDYTMRLENAGIGLAHSRLRGGQELTEPDIVIYLAHSRVTEQRASEQMRALRKYAGDRQDIGRAVRIISSDEDNHLAYCHEELLRLAAAGHSETIRRTLRTAALAEITIYRDVSTAVMSRLGRILGWSRAKSAVLAAGIWAVYVYERLGGWRRMVSLRMPARRNALGEPGPAHFAPATVEVSTRPQTGTARSRRSALSRVRVRQSKDQHSAGIRDTGRRVCLPLSRSPHLAARYQARHDWTDELRLAKRSNPQDNSHGRCLEGIVMVMMCYTSYQLYQIEREKSPAEVQCADEQAARLASAVSSLFRGTSRLVGAIRRPSLAGTRRMPRSA